MEWLQCRYLKTQLYLVVRKPHSVWQMFQYPFFCGISTQNIESLLSGRSRILLSNVQFLNKESAFHRFHYFTKSQQNTLKFVVVTWQDVKNFKGLSLFSLFFFVEPFCKAPCIFNAAKYILVSLWSLQSSQSSVRVSLHHRRINLFSSMLKQQGM